MPELPGQATKTLEHPTIQQPTTQSPADIRPPLAVRALPPRTPPPATRTRRPWLIATAAVFGLFAIAVVAIAAPHIDEGTGHREYHPTAFADIEHDYSFGIGSLEVDLRDVEFPPGVHTITIEHGIGSAQVWLPADVSYDVVGDLDAGEVDLFGDTTDGFGNDLSAISEGETGATIVVDLDVSIGYGRVRQG